MGRESDSLCHCWLFIPEKILIQFPVDTHSMVFFYFLLFFLIKLLVEWVSGDLINNTQCNCADVFCKVLE